MMSGSSMSRVRQLMVWASLSARVPSATSLATWGSRWRNARPWHIWVEAVRGLMALAAAISAAALSQPSQAHLFALDGLFGGTAPVGEFGDGRHPVMGHGRRSTGPAGQRIDQCRIVDMRQVIALG